jgi:hypothetical protein
MQRLMTTMVRGAELAEVRYTIDEDRPALYIHAEGENGFLNCVGEVMEEHEAIVFHTWLAKVPRERRLAVAEYAARVNFDLIVGSMQFDMYDGAVRFKTAMVANGAPLAPEHVAALIVTNLMTADRYLAGLLAVVHGDVSPGDAIDRVETFSLSEVLGDANEQMED